MKLFGVSLQESQGDDDGSSDNENMPKTKQVADDSVEELDTREKKISNESNSKSTRVYERKKKRVADDSVVAVPAQNLEGDSHDALASTDDSAITRVDDRKKKRVADDDDHHAVDEVQLPLKKRLFRADENVSEQQSSDNADDSVVAVLSDQNLEDRKKKRVADEDDADGEVLPLKKRLFRADENVSEQQSSDNENTQKMKQVADDAVEALDTTTRVDDRKKKRVADEDDHHAVDEVLPLKKRLRPTCSSANVSEQQPSAVAVALPLPKFHPTILEVNRNKPPTFLFKRRVDAVGVTSQGNDNLNDRCYLASYAQIENELSGRETNMLRLNLVNSPVRVIATDQKGVDYEFRLGWDGVSVVPVEWVKLRAENGLKERDTVEVYAYWVEGQFCLAISISKSNF